MTGGDSRYDQLDDDACATALAEGGGFADDARAAVLAARAALSVEPSFLIAMYVLLLCGRWLGSLLLAASRTGRSQSSGSDRAARQSADTALALSEPIHLETPHDSLEDARASVLTARDPTPPARGVAPVGPQVDARATVTRALASDLKSWDDLWGDDPRGAALAEGEGCVDGARAAVLAARAERADFPNVSSHEREATVRSSSSHLARDDDSWLLKTARNRPTVDPANPASARAPSKPHAATPSAIAAQPPRPPKPSPTPKPTPTPTPKTTPATTPPPPPPPPTPMPTDPQHADLSFVTRGVGASPTARPLGRGGIRCAGPTVGVDELQDERHPHTDPSSVTRGGRPVLHRLRVR